MAPDSPSVSVIVPTLNEEENIEGIIAKILAGAASLSIEIIVVDDNSRDQTQPIVRRLSETLPVVLLAREKPRDGLAGAVLAGARAARANVVMVIDADGSHPPEKIPELALPVINGERDMVIGSRYAPGGSTPGWSRKRRLMSRAASACAWPLTDVHDALSGFFAVRRELMNAIPPDAAGFKIALEILVRGGDSLRVGEVPIAFRDRELGQSKMGTGVILTYFRRLLALSGWRESRDSVGLAIAKVLLVWAVDFACFAAATLVHAGLSTANLIGFAAASALNAWLKTSQLPPETHRSPRFLSRLLFVSLLALFLRSGILVTCATSFGWPRLIAILPAIITGWVVLFLGYALFIWPVEDQYGRGVRWRVAAIGASAYVLALRIAFLFTLPIDKGLASMPAGSHGIAFDIAVALRRFGTLLLGPNRAGFNLPALLCWSLAAWALFKTAQRIFDKTTAFRALLLFSTLPVFFWIGSVFSISTVVVCGWAIFLWLISLASKWKGGSAFLGLTFLAFFFLCFPGSVWIHNLSLLSYLHTALFRAVIFVPLQPLLLTPLAFFAALHILDRRSDDGRALDRTTAAKCAAFAALIIFLLYVTATVGIAASGVIWLPLLPFIAFEMQLPARLFARLWSPIIYGCVILYGIYFYWLAFSR
jgi:dolichol-phosphate mannosyltransferase